MTISEEEIYRSSNGDRWTLRRDTSTARRYVRHEPNLSSGGRMTDTDADEFLSVGGAGPEYAALRRLLDRSADPPDRREVTPAMNTCVVIHDDFRFEVRVGDAYGRVVAAFSNKLAAEAFAGKQRMIEEGAVSMPLEDEPR